MKFIAPSILSADFKNLSQDIRSIEMGMADWVHCDIMDGRFVPNITFGPMVVKAVKEITNLTIDSHLMIIEPEKYIEQFAKAGSDFISVHQEATSHLHRALQQIKDCGAKPAVAINPATSINTLEDIFEEVEMILIMSVNPGFGGQKFIPNALNKIKALDSIRKKYDLNFLIQVDGGVTKENIKTISDAGCDVFVAGSAVFSSDNITASAVELKNIINK